jgi:hypothetical protein
VGAGCLVRGGCPEEEACTVVVVEPARAGSGAPTLRRRYQSRTTPMLVWWRAAVSFGGVDEDVEVDQLHLARSTRRGKWKEHAHTSLMSLVEASLIYALWMGGAPDTTDDAARERGGNATDERGASAANDGGDERAGADEPTGSDGGAWPARLLAAFSGVVALVAFQVARAVDASLGRLHEPFVPGGTVGALGGSRHDFARALDIWADGSHALRAFEPASAQAHLVSYALAELILVLAVVVLAVAALRLASGTGPSIGLRALGRGLRDLGRRPWGSLLLGAAVLRVLYLALVLVVGASMSCGCGGLAFAIRAVGLASLTLFGVAVVAMAFSNRRRLSRAVVYVYWSPATLRILLVLAVAFVGVLYASLIGSQTEDLVERWLAPNWWELLAVAGGYAVFLGVVALSVLLDPAPANDPPAEAQEREVGADRTANGPDGPTLATWWLLGAGAVGVLMGLVIMRSDTYGADRGSGTLVLGAILATIGLLGLAAWGMQSWKAAAARSRSARGADKPGRWLRVAVGAIPGVGLTLVVVRTATNDALSGNGGSAIVWYGLCAVALLGLAGAGSVVAARVERGWFTGWRAPVFAVAGAVVTTIAVVWVPVEAGTFAVVFLAMAGLGALGVLISCGARWFQEDEAHGHAPLGLAALGFRRTPAVLLLVAWLVISGAVDARTNDRDTRNRVTRWDLRTLEIQTAADLPVNPGPLPEVDTPVCEPERTETEPVAEVRRAFCSWLAQQPETSDSNGEPLTLLLVTASGGGVRAAAWTTTVLDCLLFHVDGSSCAAADHRQDTGRWSALFAAGGASGGGVGLASIVAERLTTKSGEAFDPGWIDDLLDQDTLVSPVKQAILVDGVVGAFGLHWDDDRAGKLEDSWTRRWRQTELSFCGGDDLPTIDRLGFVALRSTCADQYVPLLFINATDVATGELVRVAPIRLTDGGADSGSHELRDVLASDRDVPLFSAAFAGARFPIVTPSARLPSCRVVGSDSRRCPDPVEELAEPAESPTTEPPQEQPEERCTGAPDRERCATDPPAEPPKVLNLVDGGYVENSGAGQIVTLLGLLDPLVDEHNRHVAQRVARDDGGDAGDDDGAGDGAEEPGTPCPSGETGIPAGCRSVQIVVVEIENGQRGAEPVRPLASTLPEVLRPVQAFLARSYGASDALDVLGTMTEPCAERDAEGAGIEVPGSPVHVRLSMFEHPGRRLPLGWTLAPNSLEAVRSQLTVKENREALACLAGVARWGTWFPDDDEDGDGDGG